MSAILGMSAVLGLICIASGVFAAKTAYRSYALVLAATYLFQTLAISFMIASLLGTDIAWYHIVIPVVIALIAWLMARLSLLLLWGSLSLIGLLLLGGIGMTATTMTDVVNITTIGITYAIALIAAIALRKHGKALIIGITSGYNLGVGLALVLMAFWSSSAYESLALVSALLVVVGVGAGIWYQYRVDRRLIDGVDASSNSAVATSDGAVSLH